MAIIYTYPTKAIPNANDLILISDSEDSNKTKQVTIASLPGGSGSGVSSVTSANNAITVADSTTTPVLTSVAYSGGAGIGHVPTGSGNSASVYLDGTGSWSTPVGTTYLAGNGINLTGTTFSADLKANGGLVIESTELAVDLGASSITGTLDVADGGTGATTLTGILKGDGTNAVTGGAGLRELSDVSYTPTVVESSLYMATIPSNAGTQTGNTTIGSGAAAAITTGENNTIIGAIAGNIITTGGGNVIIGRNADASALGVNDSVIIGSSSSSATRATAIGSAASADSQGIALGFNATAGANELAIGNITTVTTNPSTGEPPALTNKFLPIKIWDGTNHIQYYLALYI